MILIAPMVNTPETLPCNPWVSASVLPSTNPIAKLLAGGPGLNVNVSPVPVNLMVDPVSDEKLMVSAKEDVTVPATNPDNSANVNRIRFIIYSPPFKASSECVLS
jgi:hypothetical protein